MRRVIVWAAVVVSCAAAGCSSSASLPPASDPHGAEPTQAPQSAEKVTKTVAERVKTFQPLVTEQRKVCGGPTTIRQADPVLAAECKQALADVSAYARRMVFLLAHVGEPIELEVRVADTADAAAPIVVVHRSFPVADCLPTPDPGDPRAGNCDRLGRELATLITHFETQPETWT